MKSQLPELFLSWDTTDILIHHAKYLVEIGEADDENEAFTQACDDPDFLEYEWDCFLDNLTEKINDINSDGFWSAIVENFGWQNLTGTKLFEASDGKQFLSGLLPETECSFKIYIDDSSTIQIQNFHHDSPTGNEWYTITSADRHADVA